MDPISVYQTCTDRVPAYRSFLTEKTGAVPAVSSLEEFRTLPFTSKSDYVMKHHLPDLCLDGRTAAAHLWLRSSGTSKKPFFWPRRFEDEQGMPESVRRLFGAYIAPEAQPVLVIVGLALGPWGTGMQSSFAFRQIAQRTPGLAVVTPGIQNESIIEAIEKLSPMYRRTVLLSYPPFAKTALEEAARRGIPVRDFNIHVMVGGESISESYREQMWALLGHDERQSDSVWSMYGSTDFANVGYENVLTITARRLMAKHGLWQRVLGEPDMPMLFQRIPSETYFEVVDGELVVTRQQGIPLVRYRTGDRVQFIPRGEFLSRLRHCGIDVEGYVRDLGLVVPDLDEPFVALYGRIDQVVFFYGAKITLDQVKTALESPALANYYNGRFLVRGTESESGDPLIEVCIENNDALRNADLEALTELLAVSLEKVQSEFREIRKLTLGKKLILLKPSDPALFELGWKTRHM